MARFEYRLPVPTDRIGHWVMNIAELRILQEIIALSVFVPFSVFYPCERLTLNYLWAGLRL